MVILGPRLGMSHKVEACPRTCSGRTRGCSSDLEDMERFDCPRLQGTGGSRKLLEDEEASEEDELVGVLVGA